MYSLPKYEELTFFIGLKISNISIFDYNSIIKFENSLVEINSYNECIFYNKKNNVFFETFHKSDEKHMIGHKIIKYYIKDKELHLCLDNDFEIILSGKDIEYECFTISTKGTTFVI